MNSKSTRWLLILAAGLFAYIFFFERHTPDTERRQELAARWLAPINLLTLNSIEVTPAGGAPIRVEATNLEWRLIEPLAYPAETRTIEGFVNTLNSLQKRAFISAQETLAQKDGLAAFGLKPATAAISLLNGTNRIELWVGARTIGSNQVYALRVGTPGVYVVDAALLDQLPDSPNAWRSRDLIDLRRVAYDRVEIRAGQRPALVFHRAPGQPWQLLRPMEARADNARLTDLIRRLEEARVRQFVSDAASPDLDAFGLQPPESELALGSGSNDLFRVQFGKSPTNAPTLVNARLFGHTNIVLVDRELADRLQFSSTDFRDRRLVTFSPSTIERVEVRATENFVLQRQANQSWQINLGPITFPADPELVGGFLNNVNGLEIATFEKDVVTDFSSYGLDPPRRRYTFVATPASLAPGNTNPIVAQIDFGTNSGPNVLARRTDEGSLYGLPQASLTRLPDAAYQLRDRHLWNFDSTNVTKVTITQAGRQRTLTPDAARAWSDTSGPLDPIGAASLEETLYRLGQLRAEYWTAVGDEAWYRFGPTDGERRVTIALAGGAKAEELTIEFGRLSPHGHCYASVWLEGKRVIFEFPGKLFLDVERDLAAPAAKR